MSEFLCLELTFHESIATLRLNRPTLHNRFDAALHSEFPQALATVASHGDVAALVIAADGASFSAGGDFHMMLEANASAELRSQLKREALAIVDGLIDMPVPVIAAVHGNAIGLGATVLACCDMVVATRKARIADPHVQIGLAAGDGGIFGWSQSVGLLRAKRHLLTGDAVTGEQAYAMGLVSDLVDSTEECEPVAFALARKVVALPRGGVAATKQAFAKLSRDLYRPAFILSLDLEMETLASEEVRIVLENQIKA